jgi:hypothetical protein
MFDVLIWEYLLEVVSGCDKMQTHKAWHPLDYISSHFNVLNTPISTTAPIDAKTHAWPIDGSAQWLTNQRSQLGHIQAKT